ncbi:MAG: DUF4112 domain-containing protein [Cyanobacteria bacterium P01_F01_bin.153]
MSSTSPRSLPPAALRRLGRVRSLARWLDRAITIPGTKIRLGLDALVGLLPVGGDFIGLAMSMYLMVEAARLGAPAALLTKMAANVAVDLGLGSVPVAGDFVDVLWQSNSRNVELLEEFLVESGETLEPDPKVPWGLLIGLLMLLLAGAIAVLIFAGWLVGVFFSAIFG